MNIKKRLEKLGFDNVRGHYDEVKWFEIGEIEREN